MSNGYVSTKTLSRIISSGPLISTITEEAVGLEFYSSEGTILCLIELTGLPVSINVETSDTLPLWNIIMGGTTHAGVTNSGVSITEDDPELVLAS